MTETAEQTRARLDRRVSHDQLAMLRISLDTFEERFDLPSWMALRIFRGEPVPDDAVRAYTTIAPDKSVAEYHAGRERIRARLVPSLKDVNEWLDQYETWVELSRERYAASVRMGPQAVSQRRKASAAPDTESTPETAPGNAATGSTGTLDEGAP